MLPRLYFPTHRSRRDSSYTGKRENSSSFSSAVSLSSKSKGGGSLSSFQQVAGGNEHVAHTAQAFRWGDDTAFLERIQDAVCLGGADAKLPLEEGCRSVIVLGDQPNGLPHQIVVLIVSVVGHGFLEGLLRNVLRRSLLAPECHNAVNLVVGEEGALNAGEAGWLLSAQRACRPGR